MACSDFLPARNFECLCCDRCLRSRFSSSPGWNSFRREVPNLVAIVDCHTTDRIAYLTFVVVVVAYSVGTPDNSPDLVSCPFSRSNRHCGLVPTAFHHHAAKK